VTGRRPRRVPMRQCAACGAIRPKRELTRIVRTPDGEVRLDPTGRANGRGAYVCDGEACRERAARGDRLASRLGATVPDGVREALRPRGDG
jgi:predicted RNA-binding protein YlxR (DUF448 family)